MVLDDFQDEINYYRSQHRTVGCKVTHLFGVPMIALSLPFTIWNFRRGLSLFVAGGILQLIGHYVFEKNSPVILSKNKSMWTPLVSLVVISQYWLQVFQGQALTDDTLKLVPHRKTSKKLPPAV